MNKPAEWLHSRSRLAAIHEVGEKRSIPQLLEVSLEENSRAFTTAKTHSLPGAIWNAMYMRGIVSSDEIDVNNPAYELVAEIATRKNELHESILREYGSEVPGAAAFVRDLASHGLHTKMALATMAVRRDVDIVLDMMGLEAYFPDARIITTDKVSRPKPDPECFEKAFKSLGLPDSARRNVLAFEDDPRGIISARNAGLYACAITTRYARDSPLLLAAEPDVIADSYDEYRELLGMPIAA